MSKAVAVQLMCDKLVRNWCWWVFVTTAAGQSVLGIQEFLFILNMYQRLQK